MSKSQNDLSALTVWASKPKGELALLLANQGIEILPLEEAEGNVDRYLLGESAAIERRTASSFLRGIQDRTLFTSAIYLRERYSTAILLVEGQTDYSRTAFHPQAVRGALSSMAVVYGLTVLSTPDPQETAALVAMIARQVQVGVPQISLSAKRKATDLPDLQRRIVEMLPGCGRVMARDLLQCFGSVKRIANATQAELHTIPGIGTKRATEIHRVLNAEYAALDTERNLEDAIEAAPELLFGQSKGSALPTLIARQHHIYGEARDRHVVDLIFVDQDENALILVELKRGELLYEHEEQLWRYLDHAYESPLLRAVLDSGARLHGILATAGCPTSVRKVGPRRPDVSFVTVDRQEAILVLKRLRAERFALSAANGT
jgi:ERCC4-type nuclease